MRLQKVEAGGVQPGLDWHNLQQLVTLCQPGPGLDCPGLDCPGLACPGLAWPRSKLAQVQTGQIDAWEDHPSLPLSHSL